jgi:hypothetical protein
VGRGNGIRSLLAAILSREIGVFVVRAERW